jgi:hypothetical protein
MLGIQPGRGHLSRLGEALYIHNLSFSGNALRSSDQDGNIILQPNGNGKVSIGNRLNVDNLQLDSNTISATAGGCIMVVPATGGRVVSDSVVVDDIMFSANTISSLSTDSDSSSSPTATGK